MDFVPDQVTANTLMPVRQETKKDCILAALKVHRVIMNGWPSEERKHQRNLESTGNSAMKFQFLTVFYTGPIKSLFQPLCNPRC